MSYGLPISTDGTLASDSDALIPTQKAVKTYADNLPTIPTPISLANGGTAKALVADNGGIVYSDADSLEILAHTATANQPLFSGASGAPAWSTATYPSTVASGDLLKATASNTIGSLAASTQYGSSVGTDGTAPVYLSPRQYLYFFDDLIGCATTTQNIGWSQSTSTGIVDWNGSSADQVTSAGHPGIANMTTGNATNGRATLRLNVNSTSGFLVPGNGFVSTEFCIRIPTLSDASDTFTVWIGLFTASTDGGSPTNGYYFTYTHSVNSGAWVLNNTNASANSTGNSSNTVVANTWYKLKIEIAADNSAVHYYVNDVECANSPVTGHTTTNNISPTLTILKQGGSTGTTKRTLNFDYWSFYTKLTSSR